MMKLLRPSAHDGNLAALPPPLRCGGAARELLLKQLGGHFTRLPWSKDVCCVGRPEDSCDVGEFPRYSPSPSVPGAVLLFRFKPSSFSQGLRDASDASHAKLCEAVRSCAGIGGARLNR